MAWYDYVPVVSNVAGLAKGDPGQAMFGVGYEGLMGAKKHFFDDPANKIKGAYDQAIGQSDQDTQKLMDFYMGQQSKAQGYYKPIQNMFSQAYGTGGIQAPQTPQSPGVSLKSMFGGG